MYTQTQMSNINIYQITTIATVRTASLQANEAEVLTLSYYPAILKVQGAKAIMRALLSSRIASHPSLPAVVLQYVHRA